VGDDLVALVAGPARGGGRPAHRAVVDVTNAIAVYRRLVGAGLRAQLQYRVSFLLETGAVFIGTVVDFLAILVFFNHVDTIGGWQMPEVALLYGLVSVSFAVAQFLGSGFEEFGEVVRRGTFDQVLVKPRSAFLQIMGTQLPLRRLGRFLQGAMALALALVWLQPDWGAERWLFVGWTILGGVFYCLGLFLVRAAVCFWTVESIEATNILTYGGQEMMSYPLHIYAPPLQRLFIYVIPLAFVNYFPARFLLDKPVLAGGPPLAAFLAVPACAVMLGFGLLAWRAGVRHYQSTGS